MSRVPRLIRAALAAVLIACGIGLGAHNAWWVALAFGVPLIVVGWLLVPRASRTSELRVFGRGETARSVPISVSALTRSTATAIDTQPTLVTATIAPPDDTAYEARWLTAMSRSDLASLVEHPDTRIPSDALPHRDPAATPEFDDKPGPAAFWYPAITIVVAAAVLFGVSPETWTIDTHGFTSAFGGKPTNDPADVQRRVTDLVDHISAMGSQAAGHVLQIGIEQSGADRAMIYDPETGQAISVWRSSVGSDWQEPTRSSTPLRTGDSFPVTEIADTDVATMIEGMRRELEGAPTHVDPTFVGLTVKRPGRGRPVLFTGGFGDGSIADADIEARPDGTIAEFFEPGDFDASFRIMRAAMGDVGLPTGQPNLRRFEIRGIADNTPVMYAGTIQNSGGVLIEFQSPGHSGTVAVVPGQFPEVYESPTGGPGDFSFDEVSPAVFEKVRADAMRRGNVDAFDRNAVDIQMWTVFQPDNKPVIMVEMAREDASAGTYSPTGDLIEAGVH